MKKSNSTLKVLGLVLAIIVVVGIVLIATKSHGKSGAASLFGINTIARPASLQSGQIQAKQSSQLSNQLVQPSSASAPSVQVKCIPTIYLASGHGTAGIYDDAWSFNGSGWSQLPSVPWAARSYAGMVSFQGKIWLMGGINNSGYLNDVWSFDGTNWVSHGNAPWVGRGRFGIAVLNNKIYVFGGRTDAAGDSVDDMWSFDGTTWTPLAVSAPWSGGRNAFATVVSNNKIVAIGGTNRNGGPYNDIWVFNGMTWAQSATQPLTGRYMFGAALFNSKLWVMGGDGPYPIYLPGSSFPSPTYYSDVWSSGGGSLSQVTASAPWTTTDSHGNQVGRGEFELNVLNGKLWLMGGSHTDYYTGSGVEQFTNDVWSFDGTNWVQQSNAPWAARDGYASTAACLPPSTNPPTESALKNNGGNMPLSEGADIDDVQTPIK